MSDLEHENEIRENAMHERAASEEHDESAVGRTGPRLIPRAVVSSHYNRDRGSERGPVALPVFKIGRSPFARGGWVRLPGASAILRSRCARASDGKP